MKQVRNKIICLKSQSQHIEKLRAEGRLLSSTCSPPPHKILSTAQGHGGSRAVIPEHLLQCPPVKSATQAAWTLLPLCPLLSSAATLPGTYSPLPPSVLPHARLLRPLHGPGPWGCPSFPPSGPAPRPPVPGILCPEAHLSISQGT